jgi:hypothetical protein
MMKVINIYLVHQFASHFFPIEFEFNSSCVQCHSIVSFNFLIIIFFKNVTIFFHHFIVMLAQVIIFKDNIMILTLFFFFKSLCQKHVFMTPSMITFVIICET